MPDTPLNPDGLEAAADAVIDASFGQELPEAPIDLATAAVSAYLAAALPEPLSDDVERVAAALHGDNCLEYPDPGEWCDCDWSSYRRMAEVAIEAMPPVAQPEVTSVEELRALPIGSVIIDGDGDAGILEPETIAFGETRPLPYPYVAKHYLPARVLYRPEVKP